MQAVPNAASRDSRGRIPSQGEGVLKCVRTVYLIVFVTLVGWAAATAHAAPIPRHWHAPAWFLRDALCIHSREGAWPDNTGNSYFGGLQFLPSTWYRAGGARYAAFSHPGDQSAYPFTASPREQIYRMWLTVRKDGGSFREWGTARACGLR